MFNKAIEEKTLEEVSKDPLLLPKGYNWHNVDLKDEFYANEVYELLTKNYVEDEDAMFRFDYSVPFLKWALEPPGQFPDWLVGVVAGKKKKLFGFIAAIPVHMSVNGETILMAEINFLCELIVLLVTFFANFEYEKNIII